MVDRELRDSPPPLAAGELLLDRYRVVEQLGEGGHSRVYRAHDERLERPVCIKLFHRLRKNTSAYKASYEHFIKEAFALSKLAHPSTLRIFDFGHVGDDGPPFQITELMNGGTLTAYVRAAGPLPRLEVAELVRALCGALSEAHELGIVHRDIKPGNILLSMAGSTSVIKLADFGIAKELSTASAGEGEPRGDDRAIRMYSRRWAAPEQMTSYPVTPASDLYSLALVTIFALTGRAVFKQKEPGAAYAERTASDERIDEILADVAIADAARLLLKQTCGFDPRQRPVSADELGHGLYEALRAPGDKAPARPQRRPSRPPRYRIALSESPAVVGGHRLRIVPAPTGEVELESGGVRLQISLVPAARDEFRAHIKAVSGFVQMRGGRPSRAVQLSGSGEIEVVAPNGALIASARVGVARRESGHAVLPLGEHELAVAESECRHALVVQLGDAAESTLVFLPPEPEQTAPPCAS